MSPTYNNVSNILIGAGTLNIGGRYLGWTRDGVHIEHNGELYDVLVDQEFTAMKTRRVSESYVIRTNLVEMTLENIKLAWGISDAISDISTGSRVHFGGEPMNSDVQENTLDFYGKAPGTNKTRRFHAYRAVSVEFGTYSANKAGETVLPVAFRLYPDTTLARGKQLGYIEDET